jgi:hypothetical protein
MTTGAEEGLDKMAGTLGGLRRSGPASPLAPTGSSPILWLGFWLESGPGAGRADVRGTGHGTTLASRFAPVFSTTPARRGGLVRTRHPVVKS